jgi:acyl-CoA synthetase (NDP forming)
VADQLLTPGASLADAVANALAAARAAGAGALDENPVDVPAGALQQDEGRIAEKIIGIVHDRGVVDALVMHVNMTVVLSFRHVDMLGNLIEAALRVRGKGRETMHVVLVLRSDGEPEVEERKRGYRGSAVRAGIPVFDELAPAARALGAVAAVERFRMVRGIR